MPGARSSASPPPGIHPALGRTALAARARLTGHRHPLTLVEGSRELGAHVLLRRALDRLQRHGHEEGGVGGPQTAATRR